MTSLAALGGGAFSDFLTASDEKVAVSGPGGGRSPVQRPRETRKPPLRPADLGHMGKRSDALELARFLAFDGQDVEQIARSLRVQFGLSERDATRMALNVVAPPPEPPPGPTSGDADSLFPPY